MRWLITIVFLMLGCSSWAQPDKLTGKLASRYNDIVHLKKTDQYDEAIHLVNKTLKKHKNHPDFLNLKAMVILSKAAINDKKNNATAIVLLDKAIASDSQRAEFYNNRGWSYQLLGQYDQAKKDYDQALALNPNNVRFWHNPIRVLFIQKKVAEVLELCNKAITKFPEDGYAYFVRSNILREFVKKEELSNDDLKKAHKLGWEKGFYFIY